MILSERPFFVSIMLDAETRTTVQMAMAHIAVMKKIMRRLNGAKKERNIVVLTIVEGSVREASEITWGGESFRMPLKP